MFTLTRFEFVIQIARFVHAHLLYIHYLTRSRLTTSKAPTKEQHICITSNQNLKESIQRNPRTQSSTPKANSNTNDGATKVITGQPHTKRRATLCATMRRSRNEEEEKQRHNILQGKQERGDRHSHAKYQAQRRTTTSTTFTHYKDVPLAVTNIQNWT